MKTEPLMEISGDSGNFTDHNSLRLALEVFCDAVVLPGNIYVSLMFCTSAEMREINKKYRGDDKNTDVLSFPAQSLPDSGNDIKIERPFLGEILIDTNYIFEQTEPEVFNHAVLQVFIHGLLHLADFDHINFQQREKMQEMEKSIMNMIIQEGQIGR